MIKAKITKIDDNIVSLTTEHGDDIVADRMDIDFGILEGDSVFLRTESGEYLFRRLEKNEAKDGERHYYDQDWKKREDEYGLLDKSCTQKGKARNYPLYVLIVLVVIFIIIEIFRRNVFVAVM